MNTYVILLVIFGLSLGDIFTTNYIISSGISNESNPITAFIMESFKDLWWLPKLIITSAFAAVIINRKDSFFGKASFGIFLIFYVPVLIMHIVMIMIYKGYI